LTEPDLSDCDLKGLGVLVTRPEHQAQGLVSLISSHNGRPRLFPAMDIESATDPDTARAKLLLADDILVFISPNAVRFAIELLDGGLPETSLLAAVGKGTAQALNSCGLAVDLIPQTSFDSEGLLAMPQLQELSNRRVLIVRGEGGRALLGSELAQRGASVEYAEVYRRCCPQTDPAPLLDSWNDEIDLVTATSSEILQNLMKMLDSEGKETLGNTPLLVISERMETEAKKLGFGQILRAENPADDTIVRRICDYSGGLRN
jgi:uroporphyrinogen-III synthase